MTMKLWVLMLEACEVDGRDALMGIFRTELQAKAAAQSADDALAHDNGRQAGVLTWRLDYGHWRSASVAACSMDDREYFVSEMEVTGDEPAI